MQAGLGHESGLRSSWEVQGELEKCAADLGYNPAREVVRNVVPGRPMPTPVEATPVDRRMLEKKRRKEKWFGWMKKQPQGQPGEGRAGWAIGRPTGR